MEEDVLLCVDIVDLVLVVVLVVEEVDIVDLVLVVVFVVEEVDVAVELVVLVVVHESHMTGHRR